MNGLFPRVGLVFSGIGSEAAAFLPLDEGATWSISELPPWVTPTGKTRGNRPYLLQLRASANPGGVRAGTLRVTVTGGKTGVKGDGRAREPAALDWELTQYAGEPTRVQTNEITRMPWFNVPRTMEFGILAKFMAAEIAKVPEPWDLLVLLIAEVLVLLGGAGVLIVRMLLATVIPAPPPAFPIEIGDFQLPAALELLLRQIPVTATFRVEETVAFAIYLLEQVLQDG